MITKFDFDKNKIYSSDDSIGTISICNNILYYYNPNKLTYIEVNDDLQLIDSNNCFWNTIEYELKIDIDEKVCFQTFEYVVDNLKDNYSISKVDFKKSYETYYDINKENEKICAVVLGKENWKIKKAIKIKKKYDSIGRITTISPFIDYEWNKLIQNSVSITKYPTFYKNKYRYILVNKQSGSVFGLSYSITKFLNKKFLNKAEIEVEYWSNILPKGSKHKFDYKNKNELILIIDYIINILKDKNINYIYPGVKKSDWFRKIFK